MMDLLFQHNLLFNRMITNPSPLINDSDPRLYLVSTPVSNIKLEVIPHLEQMIGIMFSNGGIGLAAPQVGINKRFFIIDKENSIACKVVINPEIILDNKIIIDSEESCLSLKGKRFALKRMEKIYVKYTNYKGEMIEGWINGINSIVFQHEIDHLDGKVIWNIGKEIKSIDSIPVVPQPNKT